MGLPYGEEIMILGRTMWTQCTSVSDGRTDRITITKTVQRIASHGKKTREWADAKRFATVELTMPFLQIHSPGGTALQSGEHCKQRKSDAN